MSVVALLTEEAFLNLPEFAGRQEFRDGRLIQLPPPKYAHSELVHRIFDLLRTTLPGSRVRMETGFRLRPNRWVVPDMAVTWPDQARYQGWFERSPMVAIEVASRGNTPDELQQKVVDYLENGVAEVLVIYPQSRTVLVHRAKAAVLVEAGDDYNCAVLEGIVFTPEYRTEIVE